MLGFEKKEIAASSNFLVDISLFRPRIDYMIFGLEISADFICKRFDQRLRIKKILSTKSFEFYKFVQH